MCLAVPGKIIELYEENSLKMGRIDYDGVLHTACMEYVPEAAMGQYVIVHAGFAISILDEAAAQTSLQLWQELNTANQQRGIDAFGNALDDPDGPARKLGHKP